MHTPAAEERNLLLNLGRRVRDKRLARGQSRKLLAVTSGVSERYLAQLEGGLANASILVLDQVARALGVAVTELVADESEHPAAAASDAERAKRIALIGMRGAGKSTLGKRLAAKRRVPFIELDKEIERDAGLSLGTIFELYGQSGYRRYERSSLDAVLRRHDRFVLATGGSIVSEYATYQRLLDTCFTVWLRATPAQHMERAIAQGDTRPMSGRPHAMDDLKRILEARRPLYERADRIVDTSRTTVSDTLAALQALVPAAQRKRRRS